MFFFFSNISHLATFLNSPVQVVLGLRSGGWGYKWGGPYWPGGGWAKGRDFSLWPLQFCNVLRPYEESDSLSELRHLRRKRSIFQSYHFSLIWRETRPVNKVSTQVLVCVFPHWIRLHKKHITKQKNRQNKWKQGTAAKYTHKRDPFWWYLQSLSEK